ncbi:MAG: hypothetical protein IT307_18690 [Chloroflexi bacterium]|nr:hypothetical protein [Chloroflexota bacterium]
MNPVSSKVRVLLAIWLGIAVAGSWPSGAQAQPPPPPSFVTGPRTVGVVGQPGEEGVAILDQPGGTTIRQWPTGTLVTALGEVRSGPAGSLWQRVRDPEGSVGWIQSQFLLAVPR